MEQWAIIEKVSNSLAEKLKNINNNGGAVVCFNGANSAGKSDYINIAVLGVEEYKGKNAFEKIQRKGTDEEGNEVEYLTDQPSMIKINYMVTPYCSSEMEGLKVIGSIIRLMKDEGQIEVGDDIDWADNNGHPIQIEPKQVELDRQMHFFSLLKMKYSPSLFYEIVIGIDSSKKEIFRRVKERKIDTRKIEN